MKQDLTVILTSVCEDFDIAKGYSSGEWQIGKMLVSNGLFIVRVASYFRTDREVSMGLVF